MEIVKRKIDAEIERFNSTSEKQVIFNASLTDGERLSCRWHEKKATDQNPSEDILVNFTREETEKIQKIFRR
jgi:hypothetical protein